MTNSIIPLVTPFTDDQSQVSEVRLARLIRSLLPSQPAGIFVGGDLGEFASLTLGERKHVLEIAMREVAGATSVWTNVTANTTMMATDMAQHAAQHGAGGCVLMPPVYGSFTQPELVQHFRTVAKFGPMQVVIVDPNSQLAQGSRDELSQIGSVSVSSGRLDEFRVGGLRASPGSLLSADNPDRAIAAMNEYGAIRVAKAVLQFRDLDVGPPRSPMSLLPVETCRELGL
ncbi:MAG: dihydrodipicolinate synthase family protein [Fimbriimonadaceae bacterium]|nr:dihydrodipicolinate synthase family protein [Fimbriimonadaceae bacterium]